ncbi:MAG: ATP-binding protein [Paludibacteraceae bacterium]|nr:ATP-binding protein [Paludibacteraceae bacterium]
MDNYRHRIADELLKRKLAGKGAVLIKGPKWCGKTTTAEQTANSVLYMADTKTRDQNIRLASVDPHLILDGPTPRLIDEWQVAPVLWDAVRFEVDHRKGHGHFILTGSVTVKDDDHSEMQHSDVGRIARLVMRPMSLWESGDSNGAVSLGGLFQTPERIAGICNLNLQDIAFLTCRGGWPDTIDMERQVALDQAFDYVDVVAESDISAADNIKRAPEQVRRLLRSYARHQGTPATLTTLRDDIKANESTSFSEDTVGSYVKALNQIFVVEDMPAWNPNLRSKTAIRTSDNRYFVDPSIATAALGLGPNDLINDLETFGLIFETLCVRDLRVFADALDGRVYHYRDKDNLECDAVVHLRNGAYGLIEIKLGGDKLINEGADSLLKLNKKIDTTKMNPPAFMMVLTAVGQYAFRRDDGVYVVPIGCLKD